MAFTQCVLSEIIQMLNSPDDYRLIRFLKQHAARTMCIYWKYSKWK